MKPLKRKCIVDGRLFEVYPKKKHHYHYHGARGNYKRPNTSVTCSRKCSRLYVHHRKQYLKMKKTKK